MPPAILLDAVVGIVVWAIGVVIVTIAVAPFAVIASSRVVIPNSIEAGRIRIARPPFCCHNRAPHHCSGGWTMVWGAPVPPRMMCH